MSDYCNQRRIDYCPEWKWAGRSLANYKDIHTGTAKAKGCLEKFLATKTLTEARKVLFGFKKGQSR